MSETFACRLTAPIPSAIATISVQGPNWFAVLSGCLGKAFSENQWNVGRIRFLKWPLGGSTEHVVACRVGDLTLEIHCHGGVAVTDAILKDLQSCGCSIVDQNSWTQAALDLSSATPADRLANLCNQALIQATSERSAGILLDQSNGVLFDYFIKLDRLLQAGQWTEASSLIENVSRWNELGKHLVEHWQVVLAGPPNVGKSSLINALSGMSLSIVHSEPGTTRDWIEARTQIDGWPVSLTDTAGMRETSELIEREGVLRATERIGQADLVVIVVDSSIGWTEQHDEILALCRQRETDQKILIAWNKSDLQLSADQPQTIAMLPQVQCSAGSEISSLLSAISRLLVTESPEVGQPVVFDPRHQHLLSEILDRLQTPVAPETASELKLLSQQLLNYLQPILA